MKTLRVNDYDMAYLDIGAGPALVCVHGSLNDFRAWAPVLKPFSAGRRLIAPSLRRYFPEHWDGQGGGFSIRQHVDDLIAFMHALEVAPVDLVGHSRGGHIALRLARRRPELIRKLVLAEPGGTMDASLDPDASVGDDGGPKAYAAAAAAAIKAGDLEGGLRAFIDGVNGPSTWDKLPAADRQMREDNAYTMLAQENEGREPFSLADAQSLTMPTLFVGGADTPGLLPKVLKALAANAPGAQTAMIPEAGHSMFRQQPKAFAEAVLAFLG